MSADIRGYVAEALATLSPSQIDFLRRLPKAELHAHLNGSIPLPIIREFAKEYKPTSPQFHKYSVEQIQDGVKQLEDFNLENIYGFFGPFAIIYALTSTKENLQKATRAVLAEFLDGETPQCSYLELRSTPREAVEMTRLDYVQTVLDEVEKYPKDRAALIVSLDRKMKPEVMQEVIDIAKKLKSEGRRVVGVDLCGDPLAGDMYSQSVAKCFEEARNAGLKVTLHIAETMDNPAQENIQLLSYKPNRLGHATFLNDEANAIVLQEKIAIEICLSSNLLCKTVSTLDAHHIRYYLKNDHPVAICTDDILPFRNSLLGEYALLLAKAPYGLGLSEDEVARIAQMSMESRFV
ncbi:adenosine deaminase-like protein [Dendrothele bispora CBS 962.96]|uniref:Adenosine deaminase-like protein n=1 Tax=Dendrothele bispora (strain CBS 962.96) TaxID=1314807 RepID=A0A4S8LTD3_DENBC|nr:adenosine deaminase-like protein [Dendrothele bispora CBS 962.96]